MPYPLRLLKRTDQTGSIVRDSSGEHTGILLGRWGGYAWVLWRHDAAPVTAAATDVFVRDRDNA